MWGKIEGAVVSWDINVEQGGMGDWLDLFLWMIESSLPESPDVTSSRITEKTTVPVFMTFGGKGETWHFILETHYFSLSFIWRHYLCRTPKPVVIKVNDLPWLNTTKHNSHLRMKQLPDFCSNVKPQPTPECLCHLQWNSSEQRVGLSVYYNLLATKLSSPLTKTVCNPPQGHEIFSVSFFPFVQTCDFTHPWSCEINDIIVFLLV